MSDPKQRGRDLRALWATLAVICLLGAGVAYGVTRYRLYELEQQATREARRLAVDVIEPELAPNDARMPMRGERLARMRSLVESKVLQGPVKAVRIWSGDGQVVFADDPKLIAERAPAIRDDIHTLTAGTAAHGAVTGERFRTLVVMHVGKPPTLMAAELVRSHRAMIEKARDPWYPWVARAIRFAVAFAVLYVVTWVAFAAFDLVRRRLERQRAEAKKQEVATGRRAPVDVEDLPAYMQPGFQQEVEARRKAEAEAASARAERDELARRPEQAHMASPELATASSVADPSGEPATQLQPR